MPNWCQNTLLIKGKPNNVQALLDTVKNNETALSLNLIVTRPAELDNTSAPQRDEQQASVLIEKYGAKDWYDWNVRSWGTKWDVTATIIRDTNENHHGYSTYTQPEERIVRFEFDSAWAPPTQAMSVLATQFPHIDIYHTWDEPGCDFSGYTMYSKGECVKEAEMESYSSMRMYCEPEDEIFEYFPND